MIKNHSLVDYWEKKLLFLFLSLALIKPHCLQSLLCCTKPSSVCCVNAEGFFYFKPQKSHRACDLPLALIMRFHALTLLWLHSYASQIGLIFLILLCLPPHMKKIQISKMEIEIYSLG